MLAAKPPQSRPTRNRPKLQKRVRPGCGATAKRRWLRNFRRVADATKAREHVEPVALRFDAKAKRRELLNMLHVANAAKHLDHLPEPGCAIHGIMRGNYSYADLIPAVLAMAAPARIDHLVATTLGFSQKAVLQLIDLIDSGQICVVDFLCADFFAKADPDVCRFAAGELSRRGSRFAAARCHAKIILLGLDDGTRYVSESSANIRACYSIEQFVLTNDPELYEFHRKWIDELMIRHGQTP